MPMKPKKNESKQDFLSRCRKAHGLAECSEFWNRAGLTAYTDENIVRLSGDVRLLDSVKGQENESETESKGSRRFSMLGYTGKVIDWGWLGRFVIDLKGMSAAKSKMPALLEHSTLSIVGTIDHTESAESGFIAEGSFSEVTDDALKVLGLADEGFPWQCSIGVQASRILSVKEGESYEVNGQSVEGPIDVWVKSKVFEVSFCSFGADDNTAGVSMTARNKKEVHVDEKTRKMLVRLGLNPDAGESEAEAFLAKLTAAGVTLPENFTSEDGLPEQTQSELEDIEERILTARSSLSQSQKEKIVAEMVKSEMAHSPQKYRNPNPVKNHVEVALSATDVVNLTHRASSLGVEFAELEADINAGKSMAELTTRLFELAAKENPPVANGRIDSGLDETDKFRSAVSAGLCARMGVKLGKDEKPAAGYEKFRYMPLHEIARHCLSRSGVNAACMSQSQVASEVLRLSAGSASTSDFKSIFMDSTHVRLLKSFRSVPQRWKAICNIVSLSDFREVFGVALSGASDFQEVDENGEYKELKFKDKQESFRPGKKGGIIRLSYEMIVNDDLRTFSKIPQILGAASARTINNFVWNLFLSNPKMTDTYALFDNKHSNVGVPAALDSTSLSAGRTMMRKQKGLNGEILDIEPKYIIVPPELETTAEILLRSTSLPDSNMSAGVFNPNAGKLTPISEPRLSAKSSTAWYLATDPAQVETIDVGFLDGREEPEIFEHDSFNTDSLAYKARICFGAGVMESVSFHKNEGK